jgi:hypothetical protein
MRLPCFLLSLLAIGLLGETKKPADAKTAKSDSKAQVIQLEREFNDKRKEITLTVPGRFTNNQSHLALRFQGIQKPVVVGELTSYSPDERVALHVSVAPPYKANPKTEEEIKTELRRFLEEDVPHSVEGKVTLVKLQMEQGVGYAATLTDKSEVGKPRPKQGKEDYLLKTDALVLIGDLLVHCTIMGDDVKNPDYIAVIKAIEGMAEKK